MNENEKTKDMTERETAAAPAPRRMAVDTGLEAVEICDMRGKVMGTLYFHPADMVGIVERWNALARDFGAITEPLENVPDSGEGALAAMEEAKKRLCSALDAVFDGNVSEAFFSKVNPFAPVKGRFYCENVMDAVAAYMGERFGAEIERINRRQNDRMAAYTHGARTGRHEQMKASHPIIAGWLFPGRDAISGAVQNLKGYLQAGSLDAAQSQIRAMIYNGQLTAEEAERIAAECGYAYADGMLTALPAVESASDEVVSAAAVSMEEATETYSYELQEGGAGAARAYLDGLIAEGAVSYEQAAQIATNAADGMAAQGSQFAAAAQTLADEYIGKLQGKVPEASAAGRALGDASAGAAKGVSESGTDIGAAAEGAAAAVPTAIDGQQQPAYDAGVTVGEQATSGVESGLSGFEDTVTDTMDGAAKGGANSAKRMRRDVSKHTRQLRGDVSEDFEGMGEDMADSFSGSRTKVDADAKSMAATMKTQLNSMKSTISSVLSAMKSTATSNMTTIKKACSLENISSSLSAEMKAATVVISSQWNSIRNTISSVNAGIRADIASAWSGISGVISSQLSGLKSAVSAPFASLKSSAHSWGSEFSAQLASGIRSGISRIASAAASAAATVRSYLHFSVPDKGPLADADEYGPDLIRLLADGMGKNKNLAARAASCVAAEISAGIKKGEYSVPEIRVSKVETAMDRVGDKLTDGFASMADRLQAIADSVTFRVPTVATAGVIPYSVAGGTAGGQKQNAALVDVINDLVRKVESLSDGRGANYTFIGRIDKRVLFREVLDEAKAQQTRTGKNPFDL